MNKLVTYVCPFRSSVKAKEPLSKAPVNEEIFNMYCKMTLVHVFENDTNEAM